MKPRYRLAAAFGFLCVFVAGLYLAETYPHSTEPLGYVGVVLAVVGILGLIKATPS